jgi:hypothetical protein
LAQAIADVRAEGRGVHSHAELPFDRVRGDAGRADRAVVEAVKMMGRADGRAVVAPVVAAAGPEAEVVIVEIPTRAAGRYGAAPAVAGEDRIVVSRCALPMRDDVAQEALERDPTRLVRLRERIEHVAEQRDDGCRRHEPDFGVRHRELLRRSRHVSFLGREGHRGGLLVRTDLQSGVQ